MRQSMFFCPLFQVIVEKSCRLLAKTLSARGDIIFYHSTVSFFLNISLG